MTEEEENYERDKRHFILGSAVDDKITLNSHYNNLYYSGNLKGKLSDNVYAILNRVFSIYKGHMYIDGESARLEPIFLEHLYNAMNAGEFYMNRKKATWQEDTRWVSIADSTLIAEDYWLMLQKSEGKILLTKEEQGVVDKVVYSLTGAPPTKDYFIDNASRDIYFQKVVYFTYRGIRCKALLDMIVVDHVDKTVTPIDIKTLGDFTYKFPQAMKTRRYDIQAAWYLEALQSSMKEEGCPFVGYAIQPFTFLVESTITPGNARVFPCNASLIRFGKFGMRPRKVQIHLGEADNYNTLYKTYDKAAGFNTLIDDYIWYQENGYSHPREYVESGGVAEVTINDMI